MLDFDHVGPHCASTAPAVGTKTQEASSTTRTPAMTPVVSPPSAPVPRLEDPYIARPMVASAGATAEGATARSD
ncbi:hypothetical protein FMEAI12_3740019 [Parafrankia sp. Ea1.12]|nr:hypothetical protein FMEAI12_3740019 [Parafrankia sp. Ea1.12]